MSFLRRPIILTYQKYIQIILHVRIKSISSLIKN